LYAHKQLALSGKFMAVINIAITLLWLYTAVINKNPQMYLLVWLVPMSLLALGIGWLVGGWLSGK
jgi:cytochrome bd-type quinol oxidase subunit 1